MDRGPAAVGLPAGRSGGADRLAGWFGCEGPGRPACPPSPSRGLGPPRSVPAPPDRPEPLPPRRREL